MKERKDRDFSKIGTKNNENRKRDIRILGLIIGVFLSYFY